MGTKLHTVGMLVKDMAKSVVFYRAVGAPIAEGEENEPPVEATNPDGYTIGFDTEAAVRESDPDVVSLFASL